LEVGCGDGRLTWKYAHAAQHVTGFDIEMEDLQFALVDRPYELEDKVHLTQASALAIPLRAEAFDIAILAWSL
jgi:ubiquinone/menaquinone biosynthesis C-methylase UbiE